MVNMSLLEWIEMHERIIEEMKEKRLKITDDVDWLDGHSSLLARLKKDHEEGFIAVAENFKK
ncbi:hypothetical protein P4159_05755 [Bacillus thuringiensis]|uniref:hypothetical protein n=1 Tax=Bacillus cereus group TaxID=86661 RepID=UPI000CD96F85|nr:MULTISPECIES: hypothetical protein [Bacillus cereus group]MEC3417084.1 hypothetical protein [Bacillus cereus]MEC3596903.1 hypothetical protein [Bacillus thuringiensis]MED1574253.1 hypothetical protein [Bacillus paranthracis]MED1836176.1 hypothetical protein [Bacillus thuringiensis]MED2670239.1 hypothetical protein [Bacillus thuringiensis]